MMPRSSIAMIASGVVSRMERSFCLCHIRVELQDRYRIATITPVQCPSACYYHSTAIEMSAFAEPNEPEPRRNALAHAADA
jgi:hypothetical protein